MPVPASKRHRVKSELMMYDAYQAWALRTYGDSAKTKTVTRKKYNRIVKILKGEESSSVENSKFRFWVKAKGFRIGPVDETENDASLDAQCGEEVLYVASSKTVSLCNSCHARLPLARPMRACAAAAASRFRSRQQRLQRTHRQQRRARACLSAASYYCVWRAATLKLQKSSRRRPNFTRSLEFHARCADAAHTYVAAARH